jgi:hypothetical protein
LTAAIDPAYDATMPTLRPILCVLLAVTTAVGTTPALRACGCGDRSRPARQTAPPPPPTCCTKGCCATEAKTAKHCCDRKPRPAAPSSCQMAGCDCEQPDTQTPPAPTTAAPADSVAGSPPPAPPVLLPPPAAVPAVTLDRSSSRPPDDLVISLSRLTC